MKQSEFQSTGAGTSQCDRILARLQEAKGERVPMPELSSAGNPNGFCMVHSRIADLRKRGHLIPTAEIEHVNGQVHSFYRLLDDVKEAA